jgi:hypothetical protein
MPTKKLTGDLAQTSVGAPPISITGTTALSTAISAVSSIVGLANGLPISGAGIPPGDTIAAFAAGSITLASAATIAATLVALTVGGQTQVIGLQEWSIDFKLKTADATTTDDSAWESSLPSSASWTATAKYVYLMGDPSQIAQIRATLAANPRTPVLWNFFADDVSGDDSFQGMAYIDGIKWAAGVGKIVGQDVSLKGTGPLSIIAQIAPVANPATITGEQAEN